jgi:hypothetical protein
MIAFTTLLLMAQTVTPPEARRPPDERVQTHGQHAVVKHYPVGTKIDIVAENPGSCSGPGPTAIMRLRSAEKERVIVAEIARSVNVDGKITVSKASYTLAPMSAVDLGCLAQANPAGGKPLSTAEWKIVSSRAQ